MERTAVNTAKSPEQQAKPERSWGQRIFDGGVYAGVINTLVLSSSIFFTLLSAKGRAYTGEGKTLAGRGWNKLCETLEDRGKWTEDKVVSLFKLKDRGPASSFRMVLWSFLDGSIFAILAKPIEDQREKVARWIDKNFGGKPVDEAIYQNEPKQSWWSVAGGRVATFSLVFPTYLLLNSLFVRRKLPPHVLEHVGEDIKSLDGLKHDLAGLEAKVSDIVERIMQRHPKRALNYKISHNEVLIRDSENKAVKGADGKPQYQKEYSATIHQTRSLNDFLFYDSGEWLAKKFRQWTQKEAAHVPAGTSQLAESHAVGPDAPKTHKGSTLDKVLEVGVFEAFYTAVCTIGLYVGSRFFASKPQENKQAPSTTHASKPAQAALPLHSKADAMTPAPSKHPAKAANAPGTRVSDMGLLDRQMSSPVMAPAH
ncbi:MAG: hypothetical protein K2Q12_00990 [Rickettsiales bacterium]|nr:hypothetical protein [Rickettsiales bacterium]